jgi:beta-glucosidase/6-phospho-beta-glucosidase/beta-galactosidase
MPRPRANHEDTSEARPKIHDDVAAEERTSLMGPQPSKPTSFQACRQKRCMVVGGALVLSVAGVVLAVLYTLPVSTPAVPKKEDGKYYHGFPDDFVWGAATSSYQIEGATHEGGRGQSIWDTFCEGTNNIADRSNGDIACDHYHRMQEDVQLIKNLGIRAYRFSIAWPRIFPSGRDEINPEGVAFYNHLIDELLKNDIEPWVTLYHWDLPQSLQDEYGGWHSPQIVQDFGYYATACFAAFGDRVKNWITLNESWTVAVQGYQDGTKAPGINENPPVDVYLVAHHLLLAHAKAYQIYKNDFAPTQYGKVGISNCGDWRYPLDPDSKDDQDAAERSMVFQYAWLTDPIVFGDYPKEMRDRLGERLPLFTEAEQIELKGALDFMGLNHYSTLYASARKEIAPYGGYWSDMDVEFSSDPSWKKNFMVSCVAECSCRVDFIVLA